MQKIMILGMGPGHPDYRTKRVEDWIAEAEVLVLSKRIWPQFEKDPREKHIITGKLEALFSEVDQSQKENIAFLLSGDVSLYSLLPRIKAHFKAAQFVVEPGISSVQYLFSKWHKDYRNLKVISAHGRAFPYKEVQNESGKIGILTDYVLDPNAILKIFYDLGFGEREAIVGTDLSYETEQVMTGKVKILMNQEFQKFGVVILDDLAEG